MKHGLNLRKASLDFRQKEYQECSLGKHHKHAQNVAEKPGIQRFSATLTSAVAGEFSVRTADSII